MELKKLLLTGIITIVALASKAQTTDSLKWKGMHHFEHIGGINIGKCLEENHERYPSFDMALLPLGGFSPRWIMHSHHMGPQDAGKAHLLLNVKQSVGIHF